MAGAVSRAWPVTVVVGGAAAIAAFGLLYRFDPPVYLAILRGWGADPFRFPFVDTHAVLSALECTRRGFDAYRDNPCDVLARPFIYSPMILGLAFVPVTAAWLGPAGLTLAGLFIVAVAALPPPHGARDWTVTILAALSTMSVFAVERGNIDLLIFAMVTLAGYLAQRGPAARAGSYGVILVAGGLKYYPLAGLLVMLHERPRRFAAMTAACAVVALLFLLRYHAALAEALAQLPRMPFTPDMFGAVNLPNGLTTLLAWTWLAWAVSAIWLFFCARQVVAIVADAEEFAALDTPRALFMALGAALIVGCFVAQQNVGYRGIFFLLILPGLLALSRLPGAGRRAAVAAWLVVFLMWGDIVVQALRGSWGAYPAGTAALYEVRVAFWFVRELVWWHVIATLVGLLSCFAADSEMGRWAMGFRVARRVKS